MKEKIQAYLLNVFTGLGIFLNTVIAGEIPESIFDRVWSMLKNAKDSIKRLMDK